MTEPNLVAIQSPGGEIHFHMNNLKSCKEKKDTHYINVNNENIGNVHNREVTYLDKILMCILLPGYGYIIYILIKYMISNIK